MGKLVTFWSPYIGQAKVTSTMCAIAGAFGLLYPEINVAISHSAPGSTELEEKLDYPNGPGGKMELYEKFGISALCLNYMQTMLTSERIRRCAIPLLMKNLHLYPHSGQEKGREKLVFQLLSEHLVKEYDVVFLDLESGFQQKSRDFMEVSDLIVLVLPQEPAAWERFFLREADALEGKRYVTLIGGYLEKSRYSARYYVRKKECGAERTFVGVIPINTGFFDAMSEGKALHFFLKNQLVTKNEENYEFIFQAKKTAENIKKALVLS